MEITAALKVARPLDHWRGADGRTYVYFVLAEGATFLKIGKSKTLPKRFDALQVANHQELTLLGALAESREISESSLHRLFGEYRHRGEWFRFEGALREFVIGLFGDDGDSGGFIFQNDGSVSVSLGRRYHECVSALFGASGTPNG